MTVTSLQNYHFSGAYATTDVRSIDVLAFGEQDGSRSQTTTAAIPRASVFSHHTSRRAVHPAPKCERVDSGYSECAPGTAAHLGGPPGSMHASGGARRPSGGPPTNPHRATSLNQPMGTFAPTTAAAMPIPVPYKMQMVSTPPIASVQAMDGLYGHSAPEAASFMQQHGSISQREFATNHLHPRFLSKYALRNELGHGATGFVVSARRTADGCPVAVKFIYRDRIPATQLLRDRQLGCFVPPEIKILRGLNHQNIIKYLDFFEDARFYYLVMEAHGSASLHHDTTTTTARTSNHIPFASSLGVRYPEDDSTLRRPSRRHSRDLFECIERNPRMPEEDIRHIFGQVASAVAHLHANDIVHRDIKDENVVIDVHLTAKLLDFGNAATVPKHPSEHFDRFYGTMHCAAPEILRGEPYRGPEQDVWCLGVLLYTLAFNQTPFRDATAIAAGRWTDPIFERSDGLLTVLRMCLEVDVKRRSTVQEVLETEWVTGGVTRLP
ncbi:hypothetical protein HKX48_002958 [Thoreauomyces humboldtii]|nr:hypothetical protein HKX48_002958 [Thoreauomyces humboldtii]